ncbi:MAG TPA: roadblock/LC7 domain-containing protein, partial [Gemmatimonadaceae bacterium]|nr:roadblock/LC7 domain-containing protein [Gemmatimonadaceae bacterium]
MPTIRDLTVAIRQRPGIEAVVVLGRDGLLIDSQSTIDLDAEGLAARVPGIVASADEIGATT